MRVRQAYDKYYTPSDVAGRCVELILEKYGKDNLFVEPSAGNGVFIDCLLEQGIPRSNIRSYDIFPDRKDIAQADFLALNDDLSNAVFIGNPPFGKVGRLAIRFINKAVDLGAKAACFILPAVLWHRRYPSKDISLRVKMNHYANIGPIDFIHQDGSTLDHGVSTIQTQLQMYDVLDYTRDPFYIPSETDDFIITAPGHYNRIYEVFLAMMESHVGIISFGLSAGKIRAFDGDASFMMCVKVKDESRVEEISARLNSLDYSDYSKFDTFTDKHAVYPEDVINKYNEKYLGYVNECLTPESKEIAWGLR